MMSRNEKTEHFVKDNGVRLPVGDEFFLPFLRPTSPGTELRDPPPEGPLTDRQKGRILLQTHQLLHLLGQYGIDLEGKTMLDVGTGNGLIPRLVLELSALECAVGSDPHLDGELAVSWQVHDHDEALGEIKAFIRDTCGNALDYDCYRHLLADEDYSMMPARLPCPVSRPKQYRFAKIGAHQLADLGERFDLIYCKAIEHIHDWRGAIRAIAAAAHDEAVVYFKHRPFFTYLGAHRLGSIPIPWGHLLLTDDEYRRFVRRHCPEDAGRMIDFFFGDLSYPRTTVSQMVQYARDYGLLAIAVIAEPSRHIRTVFKFIDLIEGFWDIVAENYPNVGAEEVLCGMYHILFRKVPSQGVRTF